MPTLASLPRTTLISLGLLVLVTIFAIGNFVSGYTESTLPASQGNVIG